MLNIHEPVHDTGERRTWPNMMTREGARGQEYNAWGGDGGNPPEHEAILFFTRLIAGPMDFTPGIFDIMIASAEDGPRPPEESRVRTTLAKQLALYVVIYSPMQMAADLIENYAGPAEFQFIRDVAVDWEQTRVLDARIGDYVVVARQERGGPTGTSAPSPTSSPGPGDRSRLPAARATGWPRSTPTAPTPTGWTTRNP
jgi:alpha-glucosidase